MEEEERRRQMLADAKRLAEQMNTSEERIREALGKGWRPPAWVVEAMKERKGSGG